MSMMLDKATADSPSREMAAIMVQSSWITPGVSQNQLNRRARGVVNGALS
jgi:hypothetical protein